MGFFSKLVILFLASLAFLYVKTNFFDTQPIKVEKKLVVEETVVIPDKKVTTKETRPVTSVKTTKPDVQKSGNIEKKESSKIDKKITKNTVTVYFLGMDKNKTSVFKKVQRELPSGQSKLIYALNQLILGPTSYEKQVGVFSELPKNVKILGVVESKNKIIINVTGNIQNGGGADSLYSRMKQLIKTALANSPNKPIYLYIDGKQAEVLGGEGIMISQPLRENSLDG